MRVSLIPALLLLAMPAGGAAELRTTEITLAIDGRTPSSAQGRHIPYQTGTTFMVTPRPGLIRYRLAGYDSDWTERSGDMFLLVRFLNAKGDQIAQTAFPTKGKSHGWNGSVEKSVLTPRREEVIAPPEARNIVIAISSAGPATSVGTFAINRLAVTARDAGGTRKLIGGETITAWSKGGTRPSMATSLSDKDGGEIHVLTDDDTTGHADWRTLADGGSQVSPGEVLEVAWQECFCTGMGDPFTVQYGKLPPGYYRFEVEALGFPGLPPGERTSLAMQVMPPSWQNPWYWAALILFAAGISTLVARRLVRKRIALHLREASMISDERLRIARDLHDGLGARISHISLLGSQAMNAAEDPDTKRIFGEITSMSRELVGSLSETVWMLNPKNDRLESLVDYLCRMVGGLCQPVGIRCRIDAESPEVDQEVSGDLRHHVTLAVKEAVNNALKHSGCTEIRLKIGCEPGFLEIHITDNGSGFTLPHGEGNGLENIRQRMSHLGGSGHIGKVGREGTTIHLRIPIAAA